MEKQYTDQQILQSFEDGERFFHSTMAGHRRHVLLFEPYGVTPTEFRVMAFLLGHPEGVEPSVAADSLHVLRQSMTKLVDTLEQRGYVQRDAHPTDRRRVNLHLQPKGTELIRKLAGLHIDYTNRVLAHFTDAEREQYHHLHWKMNEAQEDELRKMLEERG